MRLTTKLIFSFIFLLLASSLLVTPGCSGKGSGGCPDSVAPNGSTITAPTLGGAPTNAGGSCYPTVSFVVKGGTTNEPLSDICVEVFTNGAIALHSGLADCHEVVANPQQAIVTRTDAYGVVTVALLTAATNTGGTTFVEVASGALSAIATTPPTTK